jgi:hypothetical protein
MRLGIRHGRKFVARLQMQLIYSSFGNHIYEISVRIWTRLMLRDLGSGISG